MAANATVPNSFSNGAATDAPAMNANFAAVLAWLNANAVHLDAAKAFTAVPSGPATDPTSANQLTRKAYVDAKFPVPTASIADLAVTTVKVADSAITTIKIADANVTAAKMAVDSVGTTAIIDLNVTTAKIALLAVGTGQLADASVTNAKMASNAVTNAKVASGDFVSVRNTYMDILCGSIRPAAAQSIPNGTATAVKFDAAVEVLDPSAMHDPTTNPERVTTAVAGLYRFDACVGFATNNTGGRSIELRRYNAAGVHQETFGYAACDAGDGSSNISLSVSGSTYFLATDYCAVYATQDSGGALNTLYFGTLMATMSWNCVRL
ncbi:hypothetical protein [Caudoviricetes sp.]|nr:hypothetical protein [Caudoviricetes sp.]